ncbi:protein kinase domain-containing protein [Pseudonocardia oroxyli]|uniref:non-specific serine/threonine protein kinase n=1 Tax=Pseudonocardia oroxyli TaxID=366584 RepID=A0A1G7GU75_PSEOR|nr:protein kinase [Pseudonocardia oroxyli]SDE91728.1 Protein kinase domain-containing protein [Pseudonocardia oroxyli]
MIPSRLVGGRYLVLDGLGAGAMGPVWRAQDKVTGRPVVVRELHLPGRPTAADHTRFRDALLREARLVGALRDPGLLTVHDVLSDGELDLLVTEYTDGVRLSDHTSAGGRLSYEDALDLARRLLGTLGRAHEVGLVHGAIRPAAVVLAEGGRIAFTDTGLARARLAVDPTGGPVSAADDLRGLGETLARTAALEPPFADLVDRLRSAEPPTVQEALAELEEAGERRRTWFGFRRA